MWKEGRPRRRFSWSFREILLRRPTRPMRSHPLPGTRGKNLGPLRLPLLLCHFRTTLGNMGKSLNWGRPRFSPLSPDIPIVVISDLVMARAFTTQPKTSSSRVEASLHACPHAHFEYPHSAVCTNPPCACCALLVFIYFSASLLFFAAAAAAGVSRFSLAFKRTNPTSAADKAREMAFLTLQALQRCCRDMELSQLQAHVQKRSRFGNFRKSHQNNYPKPPSTRADLIDTWLIRVSEKRPQ